MTSWNVRQANAEELNFIYASWLNNYRYDSFLGKSCTNTTFFTEYASIIDFILHQPLTKILIAYFEDSPSVILSYMVYEPKILHYLFTKEIYRKQGIAKDLFLRAFPGAIDFTHRTLSSEPILQKHRHLFNFNPFKLYKNIPLEEKNHE